MIEVILPTQLDSYTGGHRQLQVAPAELGERPTVGELIRVLDRRYPGVAFRLVDEQERIRRHIAIFVGDTLVRQLDVDLDDPGRVQIVGALSGG